MYYELPITSSSLYQILNKIDALTSNFGAQIPPSNGRNGLPNIQKPTRILKLRKGIWI